MNSYDFFMYEFCMNSYVICEFWSLNLVYQGSRCRPGLSFPNSRPFLPCLAQREREQLGLDRTRLDQQASGPPAAGIHVLSSSARPAAESLLYPASPESKQDDDDDARRRSCAQAA